MNGERDFRLNMKKGRRRMKKILLAIFLVETLLAGISGAVETKVIVRAKSKDAKFIGSSMGGARVTVREAATGAVLAEGLTEGGTGNTRRIMVEPVQRGERLSDDATAKFEAKIDIDQPTLATVEVQAAAGPGNSRIKSSTQLWLIPGKDITGDGVTVEIPGFFVEVQAPRSTETVPLTDGKAVLPVKVRVTMMCGCPIEPGGLWNADQYEVKAILRKNGGSGQIRPLPFTGTTSLFGGRLDLREAGSYELIVYAYDPRTGNTGVDRTAFSVK
jgi:hypothetical protein